MANVIPEDMRKDMRGQARARFILAGSIVALIAAGISFLVLLPSYVVLMTNPPSANGTSAPLSAADRASDNAAILHTTSLLNELSPLSSASSTATNAITAALALRPKGVRIDQITYNGRAPSTLMLVGSADTTGEISAYRTALAALPLFTSVSIPVGALVGTDGGRFSITLSGTF